ncbi:MAG: trypsin-like peptidase domain-containing protein [Chloroflexota bacterium]
MSTIWQDVNDAASEAVLTVRQSLVQIQSDEGNIGAGTIWHSDGLIITNAHVVMERNQARKVRVVLQNGEQYPAEILVADQTLDIAALAIQARDLPTIALGSSDTLQSGEWLMAIGHPWGVLDALTAGVVIGTGENLPELRDKRDWIALDMKMRPGHSGGPLFNQAGEIVGINTMIQGPQVSFAVPVDIVKQFLANTIGDYESQIPSQPLPDTSHVAIV